MALVLVVDDNQVTVPLCAPAVEDSAIEVLEAHSVEEGKALFRSRGPDVLLVDVFVSKRQRAGAGRENTGGRRDAADRLPYSQRGQRCCH